MKKQGFRLAVCVGVTVALACLTGGETARAQEGQGKYITEATVRLIKLVNAANQEGFMLQPNSFSIGGGWLVQSKTSWVPMYTVQLESGKDYRFLGAGDADTKDLDLQIADPDGKIVAADEGTNPEAIVNYRPAQSGRYTVSLRLYDSAVVSGKSQPCLCLGIVTVKR